MNNQTPEVGTLKELNVKVGDVVLLGNDRTFKQLTVVSFTNKNDVFPDHAELESGDGYNGLFHLNRGEFTIVSRASEEQPTPPKQWQHLTPEEKGALLLAHHEGQTIELWNGASWVPFDEYTRISWYEKGTYRALPKPVVEAVTLYGNNSLFFSPIQNKNDPYKIIFDIVDGKPDWDSLEGRDL
jgi:hypothetical protein